MSEVTQEEVKSLEYGEIDFAKAVEMTAVETGRSLKAAEAVVRWGIQSGEVQLTDPFNDDKKRSVANFKRHHQEFFRRNKQ